MVTSMLRTIGMSASVGNGAGEIQNHDTAGKPPEGGAMTTAQEFDFIVVGAGSAGAALAPGRAPRLAAT